VPDAALSVVLDTNVLIASLAKPGGSAARVIEAWVRGRLDVVASEATVREAELVLGSGWLRRFVPGERIDSLLDRLRTRSTLVEGAPLGDLPLKDSGDRRLVEAAVEGHAGYLVTSDVEVLRYRGHGGTEFVTPTELLRLLAP
jgi:putative PIN family toxin of toxin-antitoxin system